MKRKPAQRDLEKELTKARMIQQLLLPQAIADVQGAELAYRYVPVYDLAGDFLDYYYKRQTGEIGFIVCDVSGHGIPAALISAMLKMSLTMWGEYLHDPEGTLLKVSRLLQGKLGDDFVTVLIGYLQVETGLLRCVNAGHTPLLVVSRGRETRFIKPEGRIIHELVDHHIELFEGKVEPGDRLVLYTDGFTEAVGPDGQMLGDEGLATWFEEMTELSPEAACDQVLARLAEHSGTEGLMDDCTLFVLDYHGSSGQE